MVRPVIALAVLCALVAPSGAQTPPPNVTLTLPQDQVRLITQVMRQVRCDTVEQSLTCDEIKALLQSILQQAREQLK